MIDSINLSTNQSLVQSILAKNTNRVQSQTPESAAPQMLSASTVNISAFSKQINDMYSALGEIEDDETREAAREGFRSMVQQLANGNDPSEMVDFNDTLGNLQETAPETFQQFFTLADAISDQGLSTGSWLDTFLKIDETSLQEQYLNTTEEIITADEDSGVIADTFAQFVSTTHAIVQDNDDETVRDETVRNDRLSKFFNDVQGQETLAAKQETMTEFNTMPDSTDISTTTSDNTPTGDTGTPSGDSSN